MGPKYELEHHIHENVFVYEVCFNQIYFNNFYVLTIKLIFFCRINSLLSLENTSLKYLGKGESC